MPGARPAAKALILRYNSTVCNQHPPARASRLPPLEPLSPLAAPTAAQPLVFRPTPMRPPRPSSSMRTAKTLRVQAEPLPNERMSVSQATSAPTARPASVSSGPLSVVPSRLRELPPAANAAPVVTAALVTAATTPRLRPDSALPRAPAPILGSRPTSAILGSRLTSAVPRPHPTAAIPKSRPTSAISRSRPTSASVSREQKTLTWELVRAKLAEAGGILEQEAGELVEQETGEFLEQEDASDGSSEASQRSAEDTVTIRYIPVHTGGPQTQLPPLRVCPQRISSTIEAPRPRMIASVEKLPPLTSSVEKDSQMNAPVGTVHPIPLPVISETSENDERLDRFMRKHRLKKSGMDLKPCMAKLIEAHAQVYQLTSVQLMKLMDQFNKKFDAISLLDCIKRLISALEKTTVGVEGPVVHSAGPDFSRKPMDAEFYKEIGDSIEEASLQDQAKKSFLHRRFFSEKKLKHRTGKNLMSLLYYVAKLFDAQRQKFPLIFTQQRRALEIFFEIMELMRDPEDALSFKLTPFRLLMVIAGLFQDVVCEGTGASTYVSNREASFSKLKEALMPVLNAMTFSDRSLLESLLYIYSVGSSVFLSYRSLNQYVEAFLCEERKFKQDDTDLAMGCFAFFTYKKRAGKTEKIICYLSRLIADGLYHLSCVKPAQSAKPLSSENYWKKLDLLLFPAYDTDSNSWDLIALKRALGDQFRELLQSAPEFKKNLYTTFAQDTAEEQIRMVMGARLVYDVGYFRNLSPKLAPVLAEHIAFLYNYYVTMEKYVNLDLSERTALVPCEKRHYNFVNRWGMLLDVLKKIEGYCSGEREKLGFKRRFGEILYNLQLMAIDQPGRSLSFEVIEKACTQFWTFQAGPYFDQMEARSLGSVDNSPSAYVPRTIPDQVRERHVGGR